MISLSRVRGWSSARWPSTPRPKINNCLTISAPRCALAWSISRISSTCLFSPFAARGRRNSRDIRIGARTLLRSWATPPARVPRLSMRWDRRTRCSRSRRSVTSVLVIRKEILPVGLGTRVQRLWMYWALDSPSRISPDHDPLSLVSRHTSAQCWGSSGKSTLSPSCPTSCVVP